MNWGEIALWAIFIVIALGFWLGGGSSGDGPDGGAGTNQSGW